jgi:hypothetical protein
VQQRTVYASRSALVSIVETAVHIAVDRWQPGIGQGFMPPQPPLPPPSLPLVSEHWLWEFTVDADMQLIGVERQAAIAQFNYGLYELLNPSQAYRRTADLADAIRLHPHRTNANAFVNGILAPSVRSPRVRGRFRRQEVLFVPPTQATIPATFVQRWRMALEFGDTVGQSVAGKKRVVDWGRPWFELTNNAAPAQAFAANQWHQFRVKYT